MASLNEQSQSLSSIIEVAGRSVVRVEGGRRPLSGVVFGPKQVVTVAHGVTGDEVIVATDGGEWKARVKGRDEGTDLALLEVDAELQPATFDDGGAVKVGQLALKLARPGETVRATKGIVSAVGRKSFRTQTGGEVDRWLEADADHRPGFSGGPLIDVEGRVLGLTTTRLIRGTSLTIPTRTVQRVVQQLAAHGRLRQSWLGVSLQPTQLPDSVRATTGEEVGLLVLGVEKGGPAEQAGLVWGDTVLHLGDESVKTLGDLYAWLRQDHVGQVTQVKLFRAGQVMSVPLTLGAR